MSAQYNIKQADPAAVIRLVRELGISRFMAKTMVSRGITEPQQARDFLNPSLDRDWLNPYFIPGMKETVDAVLAAIERGDNIVVFGDFDLDGISAATVLTRGLRDMGVSAAPFIPRRFDEGYGLTAEAFCRVMAMDPKPDFIVTVDCGISCKAAAKEISDQGFGLVITDHHEPSDQLPTGIPVCDPKLDANCPSTCLAGVGVALKLVQALGSRLGHPNLWRQYTDFAAMGTVADLMPMVGENRALVADGIAKINSAPRPCIAALLGAAGAADKPVSATNLSFSAVPRLNAAGRLGDAQVALDLLMTDDFERATELAAKLESVNDQRRAIEADLSEIAKAQAAEMYKGERALVVAGEGWHEGVKGIVASRLVTMYGVPTLLFTIFGEEARGSGRSVGQVNLFRAIESCSDLLTRFGGHEAAVGVTLPTANLPEFTRRLCEYMDSLPDGDFHPSIQVDATVDLSELTLDSVDQLDLLAPFGQENPVPCLLAKDVIISSARAVGADKNHFSCTLSDGRSSLAGIMFHCPDIEDLMKTDCVVNAAFQVQVDTWRGRRSVKAMLKSLAPVQACAALEACLDPESRMFVTQLYAESDSDLCADTPVDPEALQRQEVEIDNNRRLWEQRAEASPMLLESAVIRSIIGSSSLHESQRAVLDLLAAGRSVLTVMGTGRGKSLIFHVHATKCALKNHTASLFVYPLRALIADQAYHLMETLAPFGISATVLTGESGPAHREDVFRDLRRGAVDIVLTTPEFLEYHIDEFAESERIGFVVVDEAHHIGQAKTGARVAYAALGRCLERLGNPVVLALTATAGDGVAKDIFETLPIDQMILDEAVRENLFLDDRRNLRNRDDYLANLVASGEKTVIYVNSREQSIALARTLRKRVPQLAMLIGFYHAGLSSEERKRIERMFRGDSLTCLVTTSAFGEGIDIPNIRHVVLYHLPFNEIEFNQMSGRAGRDGQPAYVHVLFGRDDAGINERILSDTTPDREILAQVYRTLRSIQRECPGSMFTVSIEDLAASMSSQTAAVSPASVACGVQVFQELGLIEAHPVFVDGKPCFSIRVDETAARAELTDSVRYREGLSEQQIFRSFSDWALGADDSSLRIRVSRPIAPSDDAFARFDVPDGFEGGWMPPSRLAHVPTVPDVLDMMDGPGIPILFPYGFNRRFL